jgi:CRP/FNR family transcriptional regulator, cyclic AMP receptor protein
VGTSAIKEQARVRLLDADPGLGEGLPPELELQARDELIAEILVVGKGDWEPPEAEPAGHLGYLVLDGLLIREVTVGKSRSVELLNVGDLLRPWQEDPSSYSTSRWAALEDVKLAVLGPDVAERLAQYPQLASLLVERTMCRARNLAVHWAIANTVGLETRILMLFRHLAERWGKVTRDGVAVPLTITHQMVADLVGARRPSATTAIVRLAESGQLARTPEGGWLLVGAKPGA